MRSCPSRKHRFRTEGSAEAALSTIWRHRQAPHRTLPARSYRCDLCPYWHLTSMGSVPEAYRKADPDPEPPTPEPSRPVLNWEEVGARLRIIRTELGMDRAEFAAAIGTKPITVQYWEYGQKVNFRFFPPDSGADRCPGGVDPVRTRP